jgi:hypothetical protein
VTLLTIGGIEPRLRHQGVPGPEVPTDNSIPHTASSGCPTAEGIVTPEMQERISARDDWTFIAHETTFISICRKPFATADEVSQRVSDVLAVVAALPTSVAPAQVDHSADDLLARIAQIDTLEQALAFLQQLSDGDRQRLAASPTPLAKFADVRNPDEAVARLMALPAVERLQLLALFQKADGAYVHSRVEAKAARSRAFDRAPRHRRVTVSSPGEARNAHLAFRDRLFHVPEIRVDGA